MTICTTKDSPLSGCRPLSLLLRVGIAPKIGINRKINKTVMDFSTSEGGRPMYNDRNPKAKAIPILTREKTITTVLHLIELPSVNLETFRQNTQIHTGDQIDANCHNA
jgi:hypothetical protein